MPSAPVVASAVIPPIPLFDLEGAKAAGYSEAEIRKFLLAEPGSLEAKKAGYSDSEILTHFGFEKTKPAPALVRVPAGLASAAVGGLAGSLGLPGDVQANLLQPGARYLGEKLGLPDWMTSKPGLQLPTSSDLRAGTDWLGLTGRPELEPQSELEKVGQAAASGVGAAAPLLPLGGPLGLLAAGAAGGAAGEGARSLGFPEPVQVGAGIIAGGGVQGGRAVLSGALSRPGPGGTLAHRALRDMLLGAFGAPAVAPGWIDPLLGAAIGASWPYARAGIGGFLRNPLYGASGGVGAALNPNEQPPLGP